MKLKKLKKNLKKEQEKFKKEFEKRNKKIQEAREDGKSEDELVKLTEKMEKELIPKRDEFIRLHEELMGKIRGDINLAIQGVSKTYGIDVVLNKSMVIQGLGSEMIVLQGGFDMTGFAIGKAKQK